MTTLKLFPTLSFGAVACLSLCTLQGATLPDSRTPAITALARISTGGYCFARVRRLEPEQQPPSFLVLRLKIQVAYHNAGARPLIIPVDHQRTVYTSLKPGVMNIFHELPSIGGISPSLKPMKELPSTVSPENPVDPKNNFFAIIPPGGDLVSPVFEELSFPVNHKGLLRHDPDLRGQRLYLRLRLNQQEISDTLLTDLSDRWTKFGVPWTGDVMTNLLAVDVPTQVEKASACIDGPFETPDNYHENLGAK